MAAAPARVSKKVVSLTTRLNRLRNGPGSLEMPSELQEIEMTFAFRNRDYGARKFLKNDVPSILYKNPALKFVSNRPERVENPTMVLRYQDGISKTIHLKQKTDSLILQELKEVTKGTLPSSITAPIHTQNSHVEGTQEREQGIRTGEEGTEQGSSLGTERM